MARSKKRVFARLSPQGVVLELIREHEDIEQEWHYQILQMCVDVTNEPKVEVGWVRTDGKLAPPAPEVEPPGRLRVAAFRRGLKLVGARNSATFPADADTWMTMTEVAQHVQLFGTFPGDAETYDWPADPPTTFSDPKEFMETYKTIAAWRDRWNRYVRGDGEAPPAELTA